MKTLVNLFLVAVFLTASVTATYAKKYNLDPEKVRKAEEAWHEAVQNKNDGVRFSSLYILAKLKSDYPELKLKNCSKPLLEVAENDKNDLVRIHAKLTYIYLNDNELVSKVKAVNVDDPMPFYTALHRELHNRHFNLEDLTKEELYEQLQRYINDLR